MSDSVKQLKDAIDERFIAVFRDLPQHNGLASRVRMAHREVVNNVKQLASTDADLGREEQ